MFDQKKPLQLFVITVSIFVGDRLKLRDADTSVLNNN